MGKVVPSRPCSLHRHHGEKESRCPDIKHFAPPPGVKSPPLSFAARTGDLLFISGIPGFDENGALADGFEAQFGFVVANIKRVLDEAGATFRDLVKVNVLLTRALRCRHHEQALCAKRSARRPILPAPPAWWWRCPIRRC